MFKKINILLFSALLLAMSVGLPSDSWAQVDLTGFIRNYNAIQNQPGHEILIGRNRLRLNLEKGLSRGEITVSSDVKQLYTASSDSLSFSLRESYVDLYFQNSDLRIGKQIIIWGRADGTFVTDILTPVDLSEFLTQDFTDLRNGITAISYTRYFSSNYLQLVINPAFQPYKLPDPESRWFPRPVLSTSIPLSYQEDNEDFNLGNVQFAGRYSFRSNLNFDLDLGLLYWHYPAPSYSKDLVANGVVPTLQLTETFKQSFIAMYSGVVQLSDKLLVKSESAYYQKRTFDYQSSALRNINMQNLSFADQVQLAQIFSQNEDGFLKTRPWLISMIGLEYELLDWTLGTQFINEHIFNYDSTITQEENFYYATFLTRRSFPRNIWMATVFSRYNINGNDFWINPELTYSGIDAFEASLGMQLFGGDQPADNYGHISFDNFSNNSFSYLKISAYF